MGNALITMGRRDRQRGAVLYVALMMLILLALIGIVAMQVASMQERMASNYRAVNIAFQGAERLARNTECSLEAMVNRTASTGCPALSGIQACNSTFDPTDWALSQSIDAGAKTRIRLIGPCIAGNASLGMGAPVNEDPNPIYQITAYSPDAANPTAAAVVDTIFRP